MTDVPDLQLFEFDENELRVFEKKGVACFIARDVCRSSGVSNVADAVARLDKDQKGFVTVDTLGGPQKVRYVTESGLYTLVLSGRTAEAKKFRRWVTDVVLPEIRQTGKYASKQLTTGEQFLALAEWQVAQERRQQPIEQRTDSLEQRLVHAKAEIGAQNEYFSVLARANLQGRKIDLTAAAALGRRATSLSRCRDVPIGQVSGPRFGTVNTYHSSILEAMDLL